MRLCVKQKSEMGTTVYCRVTAADKDMEPELSCVCAMHKKGWMTGQAVFGELLGLFIFVYMYVYLSLHTYMYASLYMWMCVYVCVAVCLSVLTCCSIKRRAMGCSAAPAAGLPRHSRPTTSGVWVWVGG